ncbi:Imm49 family immunity protein [Corallococcus sp. bb12-1]|uniref:Imm49 family immunity protein n=1 Tax=Corallococcus sp. bb12-1 TaxID=2996784 RepID=UPI00226F1D89|nr:Imm49 family immunity protein [Corallococcus sp. bb12-1]MCY1046160.1 Imm49 family immunity protein [Corallococcus sp. bb12-1]
MGPRQTETLQGNLGYLAAKRLEVLAERPDAKLALEAAAFIRQTGCSELLSNMDSRTFFQALRQSAVVYLDLLERRADCPAQDAYYLARSKAAPFFDAVAAQANELVDRMLPLLTRDWMRRMESEEHFHYHGVLSILAGGPGVLEDAMQSFERSLDGGESARFDVARALVTGDADAFNAALEALITQRCKALEAERKSGLFDPYFHRTEAHVFVEGISLVRLARQRGLHTLRAYRTLPEPCLEDQGD